MRSCLPCVRALPVQDYPDMATPSAALKALSVAHGDMIFMLYRCVRVWPSREGQRVRRMQGGH